MVDICRVCALRERNGLGPCAACVARARQAPSQPPQRIASAEPAPAETFDPVDVLETSLRQARAIQRRLQDEIDGRADAESLVKLHAYMSKAIGQLVPTWQKLREADLKHLDELTDEQMEEAMCYWFGQRQEPKKRSILQRLQRVMNEGAA